MYDGHEIWQSQRLSDMVGGDEEFIVEILGIYVETSGPDFEALQQAVGAGDLSAVSRLAHTLKGSSGNIGADAMMWITSKLEDAADAADADAVAAAMKTTETIFEETMAQLRTRLKS